MKLKNALTASVAGAALFALAAPVATTDANAEISSGNDNSLTISGQIVRSLLWADDGTNDDVFMTDGGTTSSRVRWVAKAALNEATTVGGIIELNIPQSNEMGSNNLDGVNGAGRTGDSSGWGIRKTDISVAHKQFGTVVFGQGDPFTNGMTENGLGLGHMSAGVGPRPTAGGFSIRTSAGADSGIDVSDVFSNLDMRSRDDRLGYVSPSFNGFQVGADWIDGSGGDFGVKYSGKFGGVAVDAGVGYVALAGLSTTVDNRIGGSIGLEHDSGIGAAAAYVQDDSSVTGATGGDDPSHWGVGLGYTAGIYSAGATKFAITYSQYLEQANNNTDGDGTSWQATAYQSFDAAGLEAGLMYTHFEYEDNTTTNFDDVSTVLFSTRLKF